MLWQHISLLCRCAVHSGGRTVHAMSVSFSVLQRLQNIHTSLQILLLTLVVCIAYQIPVVRNVAMKLGAVCVVCLSGMC